MSAILGFFVGLSTSLGWLGVFGWVIIAGLIVLLAVWVQKELTGRAFTMLAVLVLFIYMFSGINVLTFMAEHWVWTVAFVLGFFPVGVLWARFKWPRLLTRRSEAVEEKAKAFASHWVKTLKGKDWEQALPFSRGREEEQRKAILADLTNPQLVIPDMLRAKWEEEFSRNHYGSYAQRLDRKATPSVFKAKITGWIAFWPISMINYVCFGFLADMAEKIYRKLGKLFGMQADKHYASVNPTYFNEDK